MRLNRQSAFLVGVLMAGGSTPLLADYLSKDYAKAAKREFSPDLRRFTELSDEAAQILGEEHSGPLHLHNVQELSDQAAMALAKHEGELILGVTQLSDEAAAALSKHRYIPTRGLGERAPTHRNSLMLPELESLTSLPLAKRLSKEEGITFRSLTDISEEAAVALASCKGALNFYALENVSDDVLIALAKHRGDLNLLKVREISDEVAEALGKHKGELILGVYTLSDHQAEALARHEEKLVLSDLDKVSENAESKVRANRNVLLNYRGWFRRP